MKLIHYSYTLILFFSAIGCLNKTNGAKDGSLQQLGTDKSKLDIVMNQTSLGLTSEVSWVNQFILQCTDGNSVIDLDRNDQTVTLYRGLDGCSVDLTSFSIEDQNNQVIKYTKKSPVQISAGHPVFVDVANVAGPKIAEGQLTIIEECTLPGSSCELTLANASFSYSELLEGLVEIDGDLQVTGLSIDIEKEKSPSCSVDADFTPSNQATEIDLVLTISGCADNTGATLEYGFAQHIEGNTYNIIDIHSLIDSYSQTFSSAGATITIPVSDLMTITGAGNIFDALTSDFIFAIRNPGGKSAKYYLIDNNCTFPELEMVCVKWELFNHPDGGLAPPLYGLRLDSFIGNRTTFSFEDAGQSRVLMTRDIANTNLRIKGTVYGGEDVGGAYQNAEDFNLDFTYDTNVSEVSNGFEVDMGVGTQNSGLLGVSSGSGPTTPLYDYNSNPSPSFLFKKDGHRIAGDTSTWVGRGWLSFTPDRATRTEVLDFIFKAECSEYRVQLVTP